ncbi:MAG: hypothetical protein ACFN00_05675 [Flavobacteriaceae bacterium]|jgi:hypothetical protein
MSDLNQNPNVNQPQDQEDLEMWMKVLSFCIPIAGAVIYFMNKDKAPVKAKSACTMADRFWCRTCFTNHPKSIDELGKTIIKMHLKNFKCIFLLKNLEV